VRRPDLVDNTSRAESASRYVGILVPLAVGVFAVLQSYRRWLDPMVDSGRDLYIPEQIRHGLVLYRDILYYYPPVTPYLLAAVTAVTGSGLNAYIVIGLCIALLTAAAVRSIVEPLAGHYASLAALLVFFSFSLAGVRGFGMNYLFPYAHAATLAMLFFLWAVACIQRDRNMLAVVLLLLASWTKIEYVVFAIALLGLIGLRSWSRSRSNQALETQDAARPSGIRALVIDFGKPVLLYVVGMVTVTVFGILTFGADVFRANVLPAALLDGASARFFYAKVSGVGAWQTNALLAAQGAALTIAIVFLLRAWDHVPRLRWVLAIALAMATWLLANELFFRAWTLLQIALVPFALRRPREPLALLLLASLCASSRICLMIMPIWYGFVFITPVVILMVYVLFAWLPARGVYSRRTAMAWLPVFVIVSATGLVFAHREYAGAFPVATARGTYYDSSATRARAYSDLLKYLRQVGARELVAMPEGLAVNYLTGVPTPMRYHTFTPVEIAGAEAPIVAELNARQPQYVVIQPFETTAFGYRGFGEDYGHEIVAWLHANYVVEQRFALILLLRNVTTPRGTPRPDSPSARTPAPIPK